MPRRGNVLCASGRCPHEGVGLRGIYVSSTYYSLISPASPVIPPSIAYPIILTHCQSFLAASLSSSQWQLTYLDASTPPRGTPPLDLIIASASHGGSWTDLYCTHILIKFIDTARHLGSGSSALLRDACPQIQASHQQPPGRSRLSTPHACSPRLALSTIGALVARCAHTRVPPPDAGPHHQRTGPRCTSWRQAYAHLPGAFLQDRRQQRC